MNRRFWRRIFFTALTLAVSVFLLAGCNPTIEPVATAEPVPADSASPSVPSGAPSAEPTVSPTAAPTPQPTAEPSPETPQNSSEPSPDPTPENSAEPTLEPQPGNESDNKPTREPVRNEDGSVTVFSIQQLLDTVAPGADIVLAEGSYSISSYYDALIDSGGVLYSDYWRFEWDQTLTICNVSDLSIRALTDAPAELTTTYFYADVLKFEDCKNISICGLTMGHVVEPGHCTGDVLEFSYCENVSLRQLDLYGCGTYGIDALWSSGIYADYCVIRECSYGMLHSTSCSALFFNCCEFLDCRGFDMVDAYDSALTFTDCEFSGNKSEYNYGFVNNDNGNIVCFYECSFGSWESEALSAQLKENPRIFLDENCSLGSLRVPVHVSDMEEFVEQIRPQALILVEPGEYNLSDYLQEIWKNDSEKWNSRHSYVKIEECFDGLQLVIQDVPGLTIIGNSFSCAETAITVDPRYATVMTFRDCSDLSLLNLTLGHTEEGYCYGNVLDFERCRNVVLSNMDIYGCGYYGISLSQISDGFCVLGSILRDCSAGPISVENCAAQIMFTECELYGSTTGGSYFGIEQSDITFLNCSFGDEESYTLLFYESEMNMDHCQWSENINMYTNDG